jgi:pimeloyl-ACP methyl ester carboxylesterase
LQKESQDIVAVVNAQSGPVFVMGHSFGGVTALEAAFLTKKISKLVLYEPPLQDLDHSDVIVKMESMIKAGNREQALVTFMQEVVMISPSEVTKMKTRPTWPALVADVNSSIRQMRALNGYKFDATRIKALQVPTLLLTGSETASPQLKQAIKSLQDSLPSQRVFVFEGQEHNAMDTVPQQYTKVVGDFLLDVTD